MLLRRKTVVLLADEFNQLAVGHDVLQVPDGPRLRVHLRIVDRDIDFHPAVVQPPKTFGERRVIGERRTDDVEPAVVAQVVRLDDQRVTVPLPRMRVCSLT